MSKSFLMKLGAGSLLGVAVAVTLFFALPLRQDPSQDFGYALAHASPGDVADDFELLSRETLQKIFAQKLSIVRGRPASEGTVARLAEHLEALCLQHRFDAAFILAVIEVESGFQIRARSPAGALGLMQLMPGTARVVSKRYRIGYRGVEDLFDPLVNVTLGVTYLAELRDKYSLSSPYYQFAAYNIGPAKLDELRKKRGFKPSQTLRYFEGIRDRMLRYHEFGKDPGGSGENDAERKAATRVRGKSVRGKSRV